MEIELLQAKINSIQLEDLPAILALLQQQRQAVQQVEQLLSPPSASQS